MKIKKKQRKSFPYTDDDENIEPGTLTQNHPVFGGVRVAHLFSFLCCVMLLCLVYVCPVSCVLNVASFSGLFNRDCHFCFLLHLFKSVRN